jgi:hypothetical protein
MQRNGQRKTRKRRKKLSGVVMKKKLHKLHSQSKVSPQII